MPIEKTLTPIVDFARIERASNGQQVLYYSRRDEGVNQIHCVARFKEFDLDMILGGITDSEVEEKLHSISPDSVIDYAYEILEVGEHV